MLDLPWQYQHNHQLAQYLLKRDTGGLIHSHQWRSTALEFAAKVHPLPTNCTQSYWHAARRTLKLFDWVGHGRNQLKYNRTQSRDSPHIVPDPNACCKHCNQVDNQAHVMLECTHPSLTPVRLKARRDQQRTADYLKTKHTSRLDHHFINHFVYASWVQPSLTTKRIWLGLWTNDTLTEVFPPAFNLLSPLSLNDRYRYIHLVTKLTAPLTYAYHQMISMSTTRNPPVQLHMSTPDPYTSHQIGALFPQSERTTTPFSNDNSISPTLTCMANFTCSATFTYSDSAFSLTDAEVGIVV